MQRGSYQNHRVAGSEGKNISARDHSRASGFELCLGIVNNIISSQQTIWPSCFLGGRPIDEDGKHRNPGQNSHGSACAANQGQWLDWIGNETGQFSEQWIQLEDTYGNRSQPECLGLAQMQQPWQLARETRMRKSPLRR